MGPQVGVAFLLYRLWQPSLQFWQFSSKNQNPVQLRITDASGRAMETRNNLNGNSTVQVGHRLNPGSYFAEVIQGSERKVVQLIKIK